MRLGSHCLHFLPSYTNSTCAGSFMFCFFDERMKHLVLEASSWLDSTVPLYLPSRTTFTYKSVQYIRCTLQRLRLCDLEVGLQDGYSKMSQTHEPHMNFTKNSQEQMICGWSEVKFTVPSSFQFQKSPLTHSRVFCWTVLEKESQDEIWNIFRKKPLKISPPNPFNPSNLQLKHLPALYVVGHRVEAWW